MAGRGITRSCSDKYLTQGFEQPQGNLVGFHITEVVRNGLRTMDAEIGATQCTRLLGAGRTLEEMV